MTHLNQNRPFLIEWLSTLECVNARWFNCMKSQSIGCVVFFYVIFKVFHLSFWNTFKVLYYVYLFTHKQTTFNLYKYYFDTNLEVRGGWSCYSNICMFLFFIIGFIRFISCKNQPFLIFSNSTLLRSFFL